jgi:hypothetical protein
MRVIASPRDDFEVSSKRQKCIVNGILTPFDNNQESISSIKACEEILALDLEETKLREIFKLPFIVTQNTKLKWLQYRINQRIPGTNKFLYKIKVKDNDFCTFCQEDEETIEHLFWNCEIGYFFSIML